jgi:hypothetical protein
MIVCVTPAYTFGELSLKIRINHCKCRINKIGMMFAYLGMSAPEGTFDNCFLKRRGFYENVIDYARHPRRT